MIERLKIDDPLTYNIIHTFLGKSTIEDLDKWVVKKTDEAKRSQVDKPVKPEIAGETKNIMLSDLIRHLRTDFEEGEVIRYRIKVKQPKSTREITYPAK